MVDTAPETANGAARPAGPAGAGSADVPLTLTQVPSSLIEHVDVAVEALLGSASMKVADLLAMGKGEVITLDRQINEAVELRVNGRVIARGEIVTVGDSFAVRITEIGQG